MKGKFSGFVVWVTFFSFLSGTSFAAQPIPSAQPEAAAADATKVRSLFIVPLNYKVTVSSAEKVRDKSAESIELRWDTSTGFPGHKGLYFSAIRHEPGKPQEYLGGTNFGVEKSEIQGGEPVVIRGLTYDDYFETELGLLVDAENLWSVKNLEKAHVATNVVAVAGLAVVAYLSLAYLKKGAKIPDFVARSFPRLSEFAGRRFEIPGITALANNFLGVHLKPTFAFMMAVSADVGILSTAGALYYKKSGSLWFSRELMQRNWLAMVIPNAFDSLEDGAGLLNAANFNVGDVLKHMDSIQSGEQKLDPSKLPKAGQNVVKDVQNISPQMSEATEAFRLLFSDFYRQKTLDDGAKLN